jgi:hypothetical protein
MHIGFWWEPQKEEGPLVKPGHRWEDNIRMDLRRDRMGWYGVD